MFCNKNQFLSFTFFGLHIKPHGVRALSKHYHMWFYTKIGHGKCAILHIPFDYVKCTPILDKLWILVIPPPQQPCYQLVIDCTYSPLLDSFHNSNIITLSNKEITTADF